MHQRGGNPVWDKHPSSMITKVAEVFVIRRQFPLGGLYTAEEMGIDDLSNIAPPVYEPQPNQEDKQQTSISASKPTDTKQEEKQQKLKSEQPSQENAPTEKQEKQPAHQESIHAEQTATTVIEKQEEEIPGDATKGKEYVLDKFES